jgi:hypothetical protein
MDLFTENSPESCSRLGLDCGSCMHRGASSVASICCGLQTPGVLQIFYQMYPSPACHGMAEAFVLAYQECSIVKPPARAYSIAAA